MIDKHHPHSQYFSWDGSHKDALTLIYQKQRQIRMTAVPSKNPYLEAQRINELFAQRRLFIRRGSKLEKDLKFTTWDPLSLGNGGRPSYSSEWKQDGADAMRAAFWGVWSYLDNDTAPPPVTEAEQVRIWADQAYKPTPKNGPVDRYARVLPSRTPANDNGTNSRLRRTYGPPKRY